MSQGSKLDVPLDTLVAQAAPPQDSRGRGGGRSRGGRRFSGRRDDSAPYARRGGRASPAFNGGGLPAATNNGAAPAPATTTGTGASTCVYVGNLPWQTSWQDLKDHMRKAGNVKRADIFEDETGRSKGCGIVEYFTTEEAQNAIKTLHDTKIDETERLIFVREDRGGRVPSQSTVPRGGGFGRGAPRGRGVAPPPAIAPAGAGFAPHPAGMGRGFVPPARGCQVFVGNLPYTTSWQDLKDLFRQAGNVFRADIVRDTTGRSKGQGIVRFESPHDAQNAIRMFDNTEFQQRIITVHEDKFAQ